MAFFLCFCYRRLVWGRFPLYWRYQLAGWLVFEVLSFPLKVFVLGSFQAAGVASLLRDGTAFLLTVGMRAIYRCAYRGEAPLLCIAAILLPTCLGAGAFLTAISLALERIIAMEHVALFGPMAVFRLFYFCTSIFVGWSFLYFGIRLTTDISERNVRLAQADTARKEAELKMLRAQMAPHFLFNALNTIRAGIDQGNQKLIGLVEALSGFLRFSLAHRNDNFVTAREEFDALADYLTIEKARFRDELEIDFQFDEATGRLKIPGILLQPLVENAVKYGRKTSSLPLRIVIRATVESNTLKMSVANTGTWDESPHVEPSNGLALKNLRHRLAILYPDHQTFEVSTDGGWVRVTLRIPIADHP